MGKEALLCPTPAAQLPPAWHRPTGKSRGGPSFLPLPETAKSELSASHFLPTHVRLRSLKKERKERKPQSMKARAAPPRAHGPTDPWCPRPMTFSRRELLSCLATPPVHNHLCARFFPSRLYIRTRQGFEHEIRFHTFHAPCPQPGSDPMLSVDQQRGTRNWTWVLHEKLLQQECGLPQTPSLPLKPGVHWRALLQM